VGGIDRLVGVSGRYRSMNDSTSWPYPLDPGRSTVKRANEDRRRGSGVPDISFVRIVKESLTPER
jgi:hypothetical protein